MVIKMNFKKTIYTLMLGMLLIASAVFASSLVSAEYNYTTKWFYNNLPVSEVRAVGFNCIGAGCTSLGTRVFDIASNSNTVTAVYPIPAPDNGYATYWMSPGYRMMEMLWRPTANGSFTKEFNFVKYASCSAPINSVTAAANVNENQQLTITVNVTSPLDEAAGGPIAEPSDADIVRDYLSAATEVTIFVRDALNNIVYTETSSNYIKADNSINYVFYWTPDYSQAGAYSISASTDVTDSKCASATTVTTPTATPVVVVNTNRAPVLNAIGAQTVMETSTLTFSISGGDPDGDAVNYPAPTGMPAGATFNALTGTFSWTPADGDEGTYFVTFSISDGTLTDSEVVQIDVTPLNHAPVIDPLVDPTLDEGSLVQFIVSATDVDGDALNYSVVGVLPFGATFNPASQVFSWIPNHAQSGTYNVIFMVSDGSLTDTETITITVNDVAVVNNAPVLDAIGDKTILVGNTLSFTINASDIDGDVLSYSVSGVPAGASFNAGTRTFTWTPTIADLGTYSVNFSVSDALLTDSEVITITVTNVTTDIDGPEFIDEDRGVYDFNGTSWFVSVVEIEDASGIDSVWIDFEGDVYSNNTFIAIADDDEIFNYTEDSFALNESFLMCFTLSGEYACMFFSYDPSVGVYEYTWYANDTLGNENHEDFEFNFVNDIPVYSNLTQSPASPAAYSPNGEYWLNITVTDFDESLWAMLEFNGTNFYPYDSSYIATLNETEISDIITFEGGLLVEHVVSDSVSTYSFRTRNLPVGGFDYRWFMMDNIGNTNQTDVLTYVVNQATPALTIGMSPSSSVNSGTTTTVTGNGCPTQLTCTLYRDGIPVSNSDIQTLADGTYNYVYSAVGNENYTAASVSSTLTVSSGTSDDSSSDGGDDDIHTITDSELRNGASEYLDISDKLKLNFCGAPYYLKLSDIDDEDDKAYFKITPGSDTVIIDEDGRAEIDLDGDGTNDIYLRVDSLSATRAKVYVKLLTTNSCTGKKLLTVSTPLVASSLGEVTKLNPKNASSITMDSIAMALIIGIILAGLSILIAILLRPRKRRAVQMNGVH